MLVTLDKSATTLAGFTASRRKRGGPPDAEMARRMRLLTPHLRRASLIGRASEFRTAAQSFSVWTNEDDNPAPGGSKDSRRAFRVSSAHLPQATSTLWNAYPGDIKSWINAHGGPRADFVWMRAPDVFRYFHRC